MKKFSKELIQRLTEACEHAEGKASAVRVHVVKVPEVAIDDDQGNAALTST